MLYGVKIMKIRAFENLTLGHLKTQTFIVFAQYIYVSSLT
jgi:hypothetical protein